MLATTPYRTVVEETGPKKYYRDVWGGVKYQEWSGSSSIFIGWPGIATYKRIG